MSLKQQQWSCWVEHESQGREGEKERKKEIKGGSHFDSNFQVRILEGCYLWGTCVTTEEGMFFSSFFKMYFIWKPLFAVSSGSCVGVPCEGAGAGLCQCCSTMRAVCRKWRQPQIPLPRGLQAAFLAGFSVTTHIFCVVLILIQKRQWACRCDGLFGDFLFVFGGRGTLLCMKSPLQSSLLSLCLFCDPWVWTPHSATVSKQIFSSSS